ncbi:uncharacterized protein [Choristoneura fumiferana]|uniref:uncharacterized protein n=1 Tax=Choristoneura fumiferana TaxID=7141 RepID=UPI003D15DC78
MPSKFEYKICFLVTWVYYAKAMSSTFFLNDSNEPESDIIAVLPSKGYLPGDADLPRSPVIASDDLDAAYFLSKLSNQELISLLNEQPKKDKFDLKDIVKIAKKWSGLEKSSVPHIIHDSSSLSSVNKIEEHTQADNQNPMAAYFRLDDKKVDMFDPKTGVDPSYLALQKIQNLLHSYTSQQDSAGLDSDDKKELLFDVLTAQLKKLCCKSSKHKKAAVKKPSFQSLMNNLLSEKASNKNTVEHEHMFLIINDDVKSDESDDLISVDPESLNQNSSVLILGPIAAPLSESQLKLVMTRITNEISKPEYLPILQQISEGTLGDTNSHVLKSLVSGPVTRRYIKPHRCNHQSKLARIHGGPKWIICTGYLNLNTPSLYD